MNKMIDGVNLLSMHDYYRPTLYCGILIVIIGIAIATIVCTTVVKKEPTLVPLLILLDIVFVMMLFILAFNNCLPKKLEVKYETEYKVTIDDNVSFKKFTNTYEVLANDGEIYTIKLKDKTENK